MSKLAWYSWGKESAERRDERNAKIEDKPSTGRVVKKNTKKWCRGKEGVEHKCECVIPSDKIFKEWRIWQCAVCGKKIDYWTGPKWSNKPKPAWVDK